MADEATSETRSFIRDRPWLLCCYCPGLPALHLPGHAELEDVTSLLHHHGHGTLAALLAQPLPEGLTVAAALDIRYGRHPALQVRTGTQTQLAGLDGYLQHSVTLTRWLESVRAVTGIQQVVLCLLPQHQTRQPLHTLFPETAPVLAELPGHADWSLTDLSGPDFAVLTGILNTLEVAAALKDARPGGRQGFQLLMADRCLPHAAETAFQLRTEAEVTASWQQGELAGILLRWLATADQAPRSGLELLRQLQAHGSAPAARHGFVSSRISQLHFLCSQFVDRSRQLLNRERIVEAAYLRARFNPDDLGNPYRDLFDFMRKIQFQLNLLPVAHTDAGMVVLTELLDALNGILDLQRNTPELIVMPEDAADAPPESLDLPVYMPQSRPVPAYNLLEFSQCGWLELVGALNEARV
ncbi:MAG: hypothetical protein F4Y08_16295 [Caldilineaceae bacterium SB0662_bin_9]|uniref:Uncharacterized protein n=1 Tax=Caldilineaceae bacterium SB0662_bin_9 TaxID=2605258 RepID=A0A6B1DZS8_9CHLR|nr:hypothetical protein [Caldilineaceae bacterium SB0662_bin_9]